MSQLKVYALILAGGEGVRFGVKTPKQFLEIKGRTLVEWALTPFERSDKVDEIFLVVNRRYEDFAKRLLDLGEFRKLKGFSIGGRTRQESVKIGLEAIKDEDGFVLIHDAVRPIVSVGEIDKIVDELGRASAVTLAVPVKESVALVEDLEGKTIIRDIPGKNGVYTIQTPQGFRLSLIREAHRRAFEEGLSDLPDDCSLVLRYFKDRLIHLVMGNPYNIKVTLPFDLEIAKLLISKLDL